MNKEAQRIAIAEACGWKFVKEMRWWMLCGPNGTKSSWGIYEDDKPELSVAVNNLPDYLNDLNAMHEAEKALTFTQACAYSAALGRIAGQSNEDCTRAENDWILCHATAAQRAEAFLRTIGLWDDAK